MEYQQILWTSIFILVISIVIKSLIRRLVAAIIEAFGDEYLSSPNEQDMARLLASAERRGFLGMLGCQDCMHWQWRNCPTAWKDQYMGHVYKPKNILEVDFINLWIWHAFFGLLGYHNDISIGHICLQGSRMGKLQKLILPSTTTITTWAISL